MIRSRWLMAAAVAAALVACGSEPAANKGAASANTAAGTVSEARVGEMLGSETALGRLNRIVANAGMANLLNGVGPYTLFAPNDAALDGLGAGRADALAGPEMRAQAVALLRAHIVPGTVTRGDIDRALAAGTGRPVTMRTMADTVLTFAREGDAIVVTSDRAGRARLSGDEKLAANGSIHPIDGVLLDAE